MLTPLAGYKTYITAALAILGAVGAALDGDMTWQQAAAIITPAVVGAALRHGLSTSIATLVSTMLDAVAKAADQMGKTSGAALLGGVISGCLWLAACSSAITPSDRSATQPDPLVFAYQVACGSYSEAKAPLAVAIQMGVFDKTGQDALAVGTAAADRICNAPTPPQDLNAAIAQVNQVAAAVLIAVAQAHGKLSPVPAKS